MKWSKLCRLKMIGGGGLGFIGLKAFNIVLLGSEIS